MEALGFPFEPALFYFPKPLKILNLISPYDPIEKI